MSLNSAAWGRTHNCFRYNRLGAEHWVVVDWYREQMNEIHVGWNTFLPIHDR